MNDGADTKSGGVLRYFTSRSPLGPEMGGVFMVLAVFISGLIIVPPAMWFGRTVFGAWFSFWLG